MSYSKSRVRRGRPPQKARIASTLDGLERFARGGFRGAAFSIRNMSFLDHRCVWRRNAVAALMLPLLLRQLPRAAVDARRVAVMREVPVAPDAPERLRVPKTRASGKMQSRAKSSRGNRPSRGGVTPPERSPHHGHSHGHCVSDTRAPRSDQHRDGVLHGCDTPPMHRPAGGARFRDHTVAAPHSQPQPNELL